MRFMKMKTVYYLLAMLMCMVVSCTTKPTDAIFVNEYPRIYPDYIGVTIPVDIAPLDFNCADETIDYMAVVVRGSKGVEIHVNGTFADFDIDEWHQLTEQNKGGTLSFTVFARKEGKWY